MAKYQKEKLYTPAVTDIAAALSTPKRHVLGALPELAVSIVRDGVLEPL